jgi:hypothetical protein|nr:hypothetical protein [uncultured Pseudoxanthomonas sp.]
MPWQGRHAHPLDPYPLSGRRSKGVEALFLMVVGWFLWFVAANLMRTL